MSTNHEQPERRFTLFTSGSLVPLSAAGGVSIPARNIPGAVRPFTATLSVPMPDVQGKKHDTATTTPPTKGQGPTSRDGVVEQDTITHNDSDS